VGGDPSELGRLIDELPPERLEPVFTHSSWAPDRASSYERLEFLGDSVLELAVARELYERYPDFSEGRMAKIRSHVVSRASCAVVARELGLGARLAAQGKDVPAEEVKRLTTNKNVLAALLEAALAALFLERGFEAIERAVVAAFQARIQYALTTHVDHKTELQEALARRGLSVSYSVLDVEGPPHDRRFRCAAIVDGEQQGVGTGASKKAAEQEAAKQAFEALGLEAAPAA
jgi:ribonuclease III